MGQRDEWKLSVLKQEHEMSIINFAEGERGITAEPELEPVSSPA